jgi:hypothetical protein
VDPAAAARRVEFADGAADPVRSLDREDMAPEWKAAITADDFGRSGRGRSDNEKKGEEDGALQWCSITRSTMLYSTASSALMK